MLKNITKYNKLGIDNVFNEEEYSIFLKRIKLAYTRTEELKEKIEEIDGHFSQNKEEIINKKFFDWLIDYTGDYYFAITHFLNAFGTKKEIEKRFDEEKEIMKKYYLISSVNIEQKSSIKPKPEYSKKMLNFIARINNMTPDEKEEIAHKISKINTDFNLTEKHYQFIKVMAETGYYKVTDITDTDYDFFPNAYKMKNSLVEAGLVQELEEINGAMGRGFKPIMLSDLGNMAYVLRFKKNPYESTYIQLIREQKSPAHGLKIQQILEILIDAGYSCSQEDIKKTPSGRDTICDILARKQKTDFRIEYEEGNYNKEDYLDKFSQVWEVTPYLIVIVPNEDVKNKISPIVGELVAQKFSGFDAMKKAGYQELVATIKQLKNNPAIITNLIKQCKRKKDKK